MDDEESDIREGVQLFWNMKLSQAEAVYSKRCHTHPRSSLHYAEVAVFRAALTERADDYAVAYDRLSSAEALATAAEAANKPVSGLASLFWVRSSSSSSSSPTTATTTTTTAEEEGGGGGREEQRRELDAFFGTVCLCEVYFLQAMMYLRSGGYVKGAYTMRRCWKAFEAAALKYAAFDEATTLVRKNKDLESMISLGMGFFLFFLSLTPPKFLWIAEALGFTANRDAGLEHLRRCTEAHAYRSPAALLLRVWLENFFKNNLEESERLANVAVATYENGALFHYLQGYLHRKVGRLDVAISDFGKAYESSHEVRQIQLACFYELGWCYYLKMEWNKAAKFFEDFLHENRAPSFQAYCAYQLGYCYEFTDRPDDAAAILASVQSRVRKHYTYDQYAARKASEYSASVRLSPVERSIVMAAIHCEAVRFSDCIAELADIDVSSLSGDECVQVCYWRGLAHKNMGDTVAARYWLGQVVAVESLVIKEIYVIPHARVELASMDNDDGNIVEAKAGLLAAKAYSDYDFDKPLLRVISRLLDEVEEKEKGRRPLTATKAPPSVGRPLSSDSGDGSAAGSSVGGTSMRSSSLAGSVVKGGRKSPSGRRRKSVTFAASPEEKALRRQRAKAGKGSSLSGEASDSEQHVSAEGEDDSEEFFSAPDYSEGDGDFSNGDSWDDSEGSPPSMSIQQRNGKQVAFFSSISSSSSSLPPSRSTVEVSRGTGMHAQSTALHSSIDGSFMAHIEDDLSVDVSDLTAFERELVLSQQLDAVALAMMAPESQGGLSIKARMWRLSSYPACFVGSEAVDWLMATYSLQRDAAVRLGEILLEKKVIHHVTYSQGFHDDYFFYRLQEMETVTALNMSKLWICPSRSGTTVINHLCNMMFDLLGRHSGPEGTIDYDGLRDDPAFRLFVLAAAELQTCIVHSLKRQERLAFFINLYNILVIHAIVVEGYPTNSLSRATFYDKTSYSVSGHVFSLNDLEHGVLRGNQPAPSAFLRQFRGDDARTAFVLPLDHRIHFALNCGARSCPILQLFPSDNIEGSLNFAATSFVDEDVVVDLSKRQVTISKIFSWYRNDFGASDTAVLEVIANHMSNGVQRRALLSLLDGPNKITVKHRAYDWSLGSRKHRREEVE